MLKWFLRWLGHPDKKLPGLRPLYEGDRGLADLHDNDAMLRLWLPEPLRMAIAQSCRELDVGQSRYLREWLVVYLYGMHELLVMHSLQSGLYYEPPPTPTSDEHDSIKYSIAPQYEVITGLGKNIVPCKLRLPSKMKFDLQTLADQRELPLGKFVREELVRHFLGHTIWPERFCLSETQIILADDWENGKTAAITVHDKLLIDENGLEVEDL